MLFHDSAHLVLVRYRAIKDQWLSGLPAKAGHAVGAPLRWAVEPGCCGDQHLLAHLPVRTLAEEYRGVARGCGVGQPRPRECVEFTVHIDCALSEQPLRGGGEVAVGGSTTRKTGC